MDINKKLSSLQEISKAQLAKIFSSNPNTKHLVLEQSLISRLEKVCSVKWLKGNGVEKIFKLDDTTPNFNTNAVFFMIFSTATVFRQVVNQIRSVVNIEDPVQNKFHIIVVPRSAYNYEVELEEFGLYSVIQLHSFQWMPIYLDTGLLSLEISNVFRQLFVYQDTTCLPALSKILWQLSFVVGKPKFILVLGQFANALMKQYDSLCDDRGDSDKLDSDFGGLVVIDRNVDYPSALLTPGIYSALLSEVYNVHTGICDSKEETTEKLDDKFNPVVQKQPVSINLNSDQDSIYCDIKNRYFTEVTSVLSNLTKQLKSEKSSSQDMALDEIKRYVQTQLKETKSRKKLITNHLLAAESIINVLGPRYENQKDIEQNIMKNSNKTASVNFLNELLCMENDQLITLRLFCLLCATQKLSESEVKTFWRKFLHIFGFSYGFAYHNLINTGFISEANQPTTSLSLPSKIVKIPNKFNTNNFYANAKNMKQIPSDPEKVNLKYPTCSSYVYAGSYIPLITQICSLILNSTPVDEIKSKLEGFGVLNIKNDRGYPLQTRSILVYVIGGVTYAELAACNLLESLVGSKIVIFSDRVVSGNNLMEGILEHPK